MKRFIFRKDWNGFLDWINAVNCFRWAINTHSYGAKHDSDYAEANLWYANYLSFMKELSESQKNG